MLDHNEQLCRSWRADIRKQVDHPLSRDVDASRADDDQYRDNLDAQQRAEALLEMYPLLLTDREFLLTGRSAAGSTSTPRLFLNLESAVRDARRLELLGGSHDRTRDDELRAKRSQLEIFKKLQSARQSGGKLLAHTQVLSHILSSVRNALDLQHSNVERELLRECRIPHGVCNSTDQLLARSEDTLRRLREASVQQIKQVEDARKDLQYLFNVFNARSVYFRQLQALSDAVADVPNSTPESEIALVLMDEARASARVDALRRRLAYLQHVSAATGREGAVLEVQECFMCTETIQRGVLTDKCGHLACEDCFTKWVRSRKACPMCNTKISGPDDFHLVNYDFDPKDVEQGQSDDRGILDLQVCNVLDKSLIESMHAMPAQGRFGSKIDLLIRHIIRLQREGRGKCIVFSSFNLGLDIVAEGLRANGINHARLQRGGKQGANAVASFTSEADISVLLLHAEAQSSGLNLLAATTIFLLEPLLDHSVELQAISRIHRIGQTAETQVFGYFISDSVEESLLSLQVRSKGCAFAREPSMLQQAPTVTSSAAAAVLDVAKAELLARGRNRPRLSLT